MSTVCLPDAGFTICKKNNDYLAAAGEAKMVLLVDNGFRMMILLIKTIKNTQSALGHGQLIVMLPSASEGKSPDPEIFL